MSMALDIASLVLLILGSFFCITAGVGLIRMPDFYTRAHSASILDSMGSGLILLGLALQAPDYLVAVKLFFIFFFLLVTSLAAVRALAQAVNLIGVNPKLATIVNRLPKNTKDGTSATEDTPASKEDLKPSNS